MMIFHRKGAESAEKRNIKYKNFAAAASLR